MKERPRFFALVNLTPQSTLLTRCHAAVIKKNKKKPGHDF